MPGKRKIVCLTPIRNEEWILERFLRCATIWADVIIILDQNSTDSSAEIAQKFEKVKYVRDVNSSFSEIDRQQILLTSAREFGKGNVLIALDADEVLSSEFASSEEWERIRDLRAGTSILIERINFTKGFVHCWADPPLEPFGFVDDGGEHSGTIIHTARVPRRIAAPQFWLREVKVIHFQYVDWERMKSKHRWYQCWETLQFPEKRAHVIYRLYHHMYSVPSSLLRKPDSGWFEKYERRGIDMRTFRQEAFFWWDAEVEEMIRVNGERVFRRIDIWDEKHTWSEAYVDPRSIADKVVLNYLRLSQAFSRSIPIRLIDKLLFIIGW